MTLLKQHYLDVLHHGQKYCFKMIIRRRPESKLFGVNKAMTLEYDKILANIEKDYHFLNQTFEPTRTQVFDLHYQKPNQSF